MISEIKGRRREGNLFTVSLQSAEGNSALQAVFEKLKGKAWRIKAGMGDTRAEELFIAVVFYMVEASLLSVSQGAPPVKRLPS